SNVARSFWHRTLRIHRHDHNRMIRNGVLRLAGLGEEDRLRAAAFVLDMRTSRGRRSGDLPSTSMAVSENEGCVLIIERVCIRSGWHRQAAEERGIFAAGRM